MLIVHRQKSDQQKYRIQSFIEIIEMKILSRINSTILLLRRSNFEHSIITAIIRDSASGQGKKKGHALYKRRNRQAYKV